jgi:TolA-binding protein
VTVDALSVRWPWGRRQTDRLPEPVPVSAPAPTSAPAEPPAAEEEPLAVRMVRVENTLRLLFNDREKQAEMISEQNRRIGEQDRTIARLQQQNHDQQQHADRLTHSLELRVKEIGQLEHGLKVSEAGRNQQGIRLGELEKQVALLPTYRHIVTNAILRDGAWKLYTKSLQGLLDNAGIPYAEPPDLPEIAPLPEAQPNG